MTYTRHDWRPLPRPLALIAAFALLSIMSAAHAQESQDAVSLVALDASGGERPFTLESTDVKAEVSAGYASVVVARPFRTPSMCPLRGSIASAPTQGRG